MKSTGHPEQELTYAIDPKIGIRGITEIVFVLLPFLVPPHACYHSVIIRNGWYKLIFKETNTLKSHKLALMRVC